MCVLANCKEAFLARYDTTFVKLASVKYLFPDIYMFNVYMFRKKLFWARILNLNEINNFWKNFNNKKVRKDSFFFSILNSNVEFLWLFSLLIFCWMCWLMQRNFVYPLIRWNYSKNDLYYTNLSHNCWSILILLKQWYMV